MALGYETTGTGPNIIANAGNAMAADIRRIGEVIRKDIQQHNQDKQVVGFLQEAKMLSPESPTFQNDLVGVFAKYPSAAGDQRALTGAKFLHDAWEQKQLKDKLTMQYTNQKDIANIRAGGANRLYGQEGGGLRTGTGDGVSPTGLQAEPAGVNTMFNVGSQIMGGLGGQANTPLGVPPPRMGDDLPVSGGVVAEENPLFNQGLHNVFKNEIKVDERTGKRLMAQDAAARARAAIKPEVKESVTLFQDDNGKDYEWGAKTGWRGDQPAEGVIVFRPGTRQEGMKVVNGILVNPRTKETFDPGLSEKQNASLNTQEKTRQTGIIKAKVADLSKRRAEIMSARKDSLSRGDTGTAENQWKEAQTINSVIDTLTAGTDIKTETEDVVGPKETPAQILAE